MTDDFLGRIASFNQRDYILRMSRSVRHVVVLLICFLLPLTGMASVVAPAPPCPAHQMTMADMDGMDGMDGSCFDEEKSAKLGYKVCKAGQEDCQAPTMFTIPAMKASIVTSGGAFLAIYNFSIPISNASSYWRPPRF